MTHSLRTRSFPSRQTKLNVNINFRCQSRIGEMDIAYYSALISYTGVIRLGLQTPRIRHRSESMTYDFRWKTSSIYFLMESNVVCHAT